ncbi:MAG: ABC transporter permease, partial [Clostridia bacterium]
MKKYQKYIAPYWIYFVLSPLLMLVEVYCDVKIPALSTDIINIGVTNGDPGKILLISAQMLVFVLVAVLSGVAASFCATRASVNFACDLRADVFKKIQDFSFANIDKFSTGSLVTRLTNDITQMQQIVVMCLRMMFRAPGMLVGAIFMSYMLSPSLSFIFLLLVPALSIVIFLILMFSYKKFGFLQTKVDALNSNVQEILTNVRVIKALTREGHECDRFEGVNSDLRLTGVRAYRVTILQMPIMTVVVNFATIAVLWFGSRALGAGELEVGNISALITYLTQMLASVN